MILNTAWQDNPALLTEAAERFGSQSVIASIDVKQDVLRRPRCMTQCGTRPVEGTPAELARHAQEAGAGEVLLNSIDRDSAMQGYDLKLVKGVAEAVSIPVIACGGAGSAADMEVVLHQAGAHAAAAGSMFVFYGPRRAVLIHVPEEKELFELGVYRDA